MSKGKIYIGTSGWHYTHWKGPFYPKKYPAEKFLAYYSHKFNTLEINNTFYRLPSRSQFKKWGKNVPAGFMFSIKASRYITHQKKLRDAEKGSLENFASKIKGLGEKIGPVIFQLPPKWEVNEERLEKFLAICRKYRLRRLAIEFRNRSWISKTVRQILVKYGAAFCIYDLNGYLAPEWITAGFTYLRFHGPKGPYQGQYSDRFLKVWALKISVWAAEGKDVYFYFDNDQAGYAPKNALTLKHFLHLR